MQILYVTSSLPYGPGEAFFLPELRELRAAGQDVTVVPVWARGPVLHGGARELDAVQPRPVSMKILAGAVREVLRHPVAVTRELLRLRRSDSIRHLVANLVVFPKALWLASFLRRDKFDHVHGCWASTSGTIAMIAGRLSATPWSFSAHRWDIRKPNLLENKVQTAQFARFISKAGLRAARVNGGNPVVLHLGQQLPTPAYVPVHRPLRIVCPASLTAVKGHIYLLEAAAILVHRKVDFELRLAGNGELRLTLEQQVAQLGIFKHVHFLGQLPHEQLVAEYISNRVDLVVLPSLDEGIPVSLMEALAYGVPVVATDVGGTGELLHDGAGILVPARNPQALADAIARVAKDVDLRRKLSITGRARVEREFDVKQTARELLEHMAESTAPANA